LPAADGVAARRGKQKKKKSRDVAANSTTPSGGWPHSTQFGDQVGEGGRREERTQVGKKKKGKRGRGEIARHKAEKIKNAKQGNKEGSRSPSDPRVSLSFQRKCGWADD
jgi:hypothetical protein